MMKKVLFLKSVYYVYGGEMVVVLFVVNYLINGFIVLEIGFVCFEFVFLVFYKIYFVYISFKRYRFMFIVEILLWIE